MLFEEPKISRQGAKAQSIWDQTDPEKTPDLILAPLRLCGKTIFVHSGLSSRQGEGAKPNTRNTVAQRLSNGGAG
jgi:hypothetical protein